MCVCVPYMCRSEHSAQSLLIKLRAAAIDSRLSRCQRLISRCAECSLRITAATEHRPLISHRQRSLAAAQLQSRSTDLACSAAKSCSAARLRWHAPAVVAPALCARGPSERMAPRLQLRLDSRGTMAAVSSLQDCVSPARPSTRTSAVMAPGQSRWDGRTIG